MCYPLESKEVIGCYECPYRIDAPVRELERAKKNYVVCGYTNLSCITEMNGKLERISPLILSLPRTRKKRKEDIKLDERSLHVTK
jgi:hypothetical protein